MIVTSSDLKCPGDFGDNPIKPKTEDPSPLEETKCLSCAEKWELDEGARNLVSIMMHCVDPWVIFTCPACKAPFLITASGKSHKSIPDDGVVVMHVDKYWIARVVEEKSGDDLPG